MQSLWPGGVVWRLCTGRWQARRRGCGRSRCSSTSRWRCAISCRCRQRLRGWRWSPGWVGQSGWRVCWLCVRVPLGGCLLLRGLGVGDVASELEVLAKKALGHTPAAGENALGLEMDPRLRPHCVRNSIEGCSGSCSRMALIMPRSVWELEKRGL